jgi:tetratricopeptide (TPR) repeat protein
VAQLSPETLRPQLGVYLDALVRKELVEPDDAPVDDEAFRFHHILFRDAAYRSMLKERRAELHERYADWLQSRSEEAESEQEDLVGYHLEQAYHLLNELGPLDQRGREIARRASMELAASARRAAARGDLPAAVNLVERALELSPEGDPGRSELTLLLSSALLNLGEAKRAAEALEKAAKEASGNELAEAHVSVQRAYLRLFADPDKSPAEVTSIAEKAIETFQKADDHLGLARALRILATTIWSEGRVAEATAALTRSLEHARQAGDAREESVSFQWMYLSHYAGPTTVEASRELFDEFFERGERDRVGYAGLLHIQGAFEIIGGEIERGRELYKQGREIYAEHGQRHHAAIGAVLAADAEMQAGNAELAEELLLPAMETLLQLEDRTYATETAALLSGALFAQGKIEEAAHFASISEDAAVEGDVIQMSAWRIVRSLVLVAEGKPEAAEDLARKAVDLVANSDAPSSRAEAAMALAGVLMAQGKNEEARSFVEKAEAAYKEKGNVLGAARAAEMLGAFA